MACDAFFPFGALIEVHDAVTTHAASHATRPAIVLVLIGDIFITYLSPFDPFLRSRWSACVRVGRKVKTSATHFSTGVTKNHVRTLFGNHDGWSGSVSRDR